MPRATWRYSPILRRSGKHSRSSVGVRAVTPRSTLAGRLLTTRSRGYDLRRKLSPYSPDVILSNTTPTTIALLQQTRTIPIVFAIVADPIGSGFVASFARPSGNVTGFTFTEPTMAGKWLELLKEIAPRVVRIAMLFNPVSATYADYWLNPFRAAAPSFAVEAIATPVRDTSELEPVIAEIGR